MLRFTELLSILGTGTAEQELTLEMEEVSRRARETGKPATLTLVVTVKPNGEERAFVEYGITTKLPKPATASSLFFFTGAGALTRQNPQLDIYREINRGEGK